MKSDAYIQFLEQEVSEAESIAGNSRSPKIKTVFGSRAEALREALEEYSRCHAPEETTPSFDDDTLIAMSRIATGMFNPDTPADDSLVSKWKTVNEGCLNYFNSQTLNSLARTAVDLCNFDLEEGTDDFNHAVSHVVLQWASHVSGIRQLVV